MRYLHGFVRILGLILASLICGQLVSGEDASSSRPIWGRLANPGFENARIKTTLFFPGQARDGTQPYECYAGPNMGLYTVSPIDDRHLQWSDSRVNQTFAVEQMIAAGINTVAMSSWGEDFLPCSTGWSWWAPMQCSSESQDELFAAAVGRPIHVLPFLESRADWSFHAEFPKWGSDVAPGTVSQIVNLLERYVLVEGRNNRASQWAQVYDRQGNVRYAITIIHASSDSLNAGDHLRYTQGFAAIAEEVYRRTHVRVGFLIDALPPNTYAPGSFKPSAQTTGPYLSQESSILGILCFIPEVWIGSSQDQAVIQWKRQFCRNWEQTGIPFLMDVSPGYDAHLVFPDSVRYGLSIEWTVALTNMVQDYGQDGLCFNSWNGYTEGMAAVATGEHGDVFYHWLTTLTCIHPDATCQEQTRCLEQHLEGDLNQDCQVDFRDLAILAEQWLQTM